MADNFRHIQKDKYIPSLSEGKTSSVCMLTANILINRDKLNFLFFFFFLKSINSFIWLCQVLVVDTGPSIFIAACGIFFFFSLVVACKLLVAANRIQTLGLNPGTLHWKWGVLATRPSPYQIFLNFTDSWARYEFSMAIKGLLLNTHTSNVRGRKHKENWSEFQLQLGYVTSSLFLLCPSLHPSSLPDRDCLTSSHSGIAVKSLLQITYARFLMVLFFSLNLDR